MLLDWYAHTLDDAGMARYLPLLSGTLAFFALHYGDVASLQPNATLRVFPTQVPDPHPDPDPHPHPDPQPDPHPNGVPSARLASIVLTMAPIAPAATDAARHSCGASGSGGAQPSGASPPG